MCVKADAIYLAKKAYSMIKNELQTVNILLKLYIKRHNQISKYDYIDIMYNNWSFDVNF